MARRRLWLPALPLLALPLLAPAAGAGTAIGDPVYHWLFHRYPSDGAGGFTAAVLVEESEQEGGSLSDGVSLDGGGSFDAEVFASEGAADFWARANSPFAFEPQAGDSIGARAELRVSQVFRKDAEDATLSFTIPGSQLGAIQFGGEDNEGLSAILVHSLEAGAFFAFAEEARLEGNGGDWTFTDSGELPFELTAGSLTGASVSFEFSEPYERDIDLSALLPGEEFAVTYTVIADAIDTVQAGKTGAQVSGGFDPSDDTDGISFEFDGLTPIGAPEPGAPLLWAAGGAVLAGLRQLGGRRPSARARASSSS
jgi:hypothetical protein